MSASGERICRLAEQASAAASHDEALRTLRQLRDEIDDFERQHVARALTAGASVSAVARALGVSRQSAHRRFRDLARPRASSKHPRPTPEVRLVVEYARREARDLDAEAVGSEHLLLGILRLDDHPVAHRLNELGASIEAVRSAARAVDGRAEDRREAKRVLAEALRAARRDGADRIGVEHILAGALNDPAGGATSVLLALDVVVSKC